jgi:hypothetical protein
MEHGVPSCHSSCHDRIFLVFTEAADNLENLEKRRKALGSWAKTCVCIGMRTWALTYERPGVWLFDDLRTHMILESQHLMNWWKQKSGKSMREEKER